MPEYYIGMDVHKRTISFCAKRADGALVKRGRIPARRESLGALVTHWPTAAAQYGMEATLTSHWVYDHLRELGCDARMGHALRMKAIAAGKHSNDKLDAATIADLLRTQFFPEVRVIGAELRHLREQLRFRNLLVKQMVQWKNKISGLLLRYGVEDVDSRRAGQRSTWSELQGCPDLPDPVAALIRRAIPLRDLLSRSERCVVKHVARHPLIAERVRRLRSIPGVGLLTALTWTLEIGEVERISSSKKAVSYCGLCGGDSVSADKHYRGPLSKQRNRHLQTTLVEAAKLAPRYNPALKAEHDRELQHGDPNQATLAVARKLVKVLLALDRSGATYDPTRLGGGSSSTTAQAATSPPPPVKVGSGAEALPLPASLAPGSPALQATLTARCARPGPRRQPRAQLS
jgi:transposase